MYICSELKFKKTMQEIKQIRQKLNIPQREISEKLEISLNTYKNWEKKGCDLVSKIKVLEFLKDYEFNDKFLGLGVAILSKELNINKGNLSVYMRSGREIKGLDKVLSDRRKELIYLKVECMRLFVKYSEKQ